MPKSLTLKDIKFPFKVRYIHQIKKESSIGISVFGYENKEEHPVYVSKKRSEEEHVDLLLIVEKEKRHYVVTKDFNTFL